MSISTELSMLAWTSGVTLLFWLPYILARMARYGMMATLTYRADKEPVPEWAERAKKAHYNAIENLAPFAALVLVAHVTQSTNGATAAAAITYFWARVAHYVLYTAGIPFTRTISFTIGWLALVCIFYQIVT